MVAVQQRVPAVLTPTATQCRAAVGQERALSIDQCASTAAYHSDPWLREFGLTCTSELMRVAG
eukprot:COSAG01_NODE_724_length_14056_cov_41.795443_8_plen_63_part_00